MKEIVYLTMVDMKMGKTYFSSFHMNGCLEENCFIKKHESYR